MTGKRPLGVWFICVGWVVWLIPGLWFLMRFYLDKPALSDAQQAYFESVGVVSQAIGAATGLVFVVGLVSLFRLRRTAVPLLGIAVVCTTVHLLWHAVMTNWAALGLGLGAVIGLLVYLAIYGYAWRLRRQGLLA